MKKIALYFILLLVIFETKAQFNDYDYTFHTFDGTSKRMKMWIPQSSTHVRGVFLLLNQMMDNPGLDSSVRVVCAAEDIAIVSIYNITAKTDIYDGLTTLANLSGFPEVANCPFITIGQSASGILAKDMAYFDPDRCFGVIQLNAVSYDPPSGYTNVIGKIPFMSIKNVNEPTGDTWYQAASLMITKYRSQGNFSVLISQPGGGHFGYTKFESKFIALFLQKAAHYQLPYDSWATSGTIAINRLNESDGWISDTVIATDPTNTPASFNSYTGDKTKGYWHMDEEFAKIWLDMHRTEYNKQKQTVSQTSFTKNGSEWSDYSPLLKYATNSQIPFSTSASSGLSTSLQVYYTLFGVENGSLYSKPARKGLLNNGKSDWVVISQEGNANYRYAETSVKLNISDKTGTAQSVTATDITDKTTNDSPISYTATAPGGQVDEFVVSGAIKKVAGNWVIQDFAGVQSQVVIRYAQEGDGTYATSPVVSDEFTITNTKSIQTVSFINVPQLVNNTNSFTLSSTGAVGSVKYFLVSGPATLQGNVITPNGKNGTIVVMVLASSTANQKYAKSVRYIKYDQSVLAHDKKKAEFNIFPNPAQEILNIRYSSSDIGAVQLEILDFSGKTVRKIVNQQINFVNVSGLKSGIYFLKLITSSGVMTKAFVKQ